MSFLNENRKDKKTKMWVSIIIISLIVLIFWLLTLKYQFALIGSKEQETDNFWIKLKQELNQVFEKPAGNTPVLRNSEASSTIESLSAVSYTHLTLPTN